MQKCQIISSNSIQSSSCQLTCHRDAPSKRLTMQSIDPYWMNLNQYVIYWQVEKLPYKMTWRWHIRQIALKPSLMLWFKKRSHETISYAWEKEFYFNYLYAETVNSIPTKSTCLILVSLICCLLKTSKGYSPLHFFYTTIMLKVFNSKTWAQNYSKFWIEVCV